MDPAVIGTRLVSSVVAPLVKKLFVREGPGAGLVDKPVRLSALVSFRGEKRTLTEKDVWRLADRLVQRAVESPGEQPFPRDEESAVTDALAHKLLALGGLDMDDVQAVRLGHQELAQRLHAHSPTPGHLSTDAAYFLEFVTELACVHIVDFFTRRTTFEARTLVEQSRGQAELGAKLDELIARSGRQDTRDASFERRYLTYLAKKHGQLTIYGIDLHHSPDAWPLDVAYLSLEAAASARAETDRASTMAGSVKGPLALPADQALVGRSKVLLRGVAGSGKTTLVQWLAMSAARQRVDDRMHYLTGLIPFVLPLRTLTRNGERLPTPDRFLSDVGCPLTPPAEWADRVLLAGRGLLLIDGIDEIPQKERARTRRWLQDLLNAFDGNRWLVTTRPSAVRESWLAADGFAELTLSPMNGAEVASFVRRWHTAADASAYEEQLLDALRTKHDLASLATNPLMCGLICALHRDRRGYLPKGRKELYAAALSMLLHRRDRERDIEGPVVAEEPQIQVLQRFAYHLIKNGRTVMDRARAEKIIADSLPAVPELLVLGDTPDTVYQRFLLRTGLLREPAPDTVVFIHRTFQDYLGARAAVEDGDFGLLCAHAGNDQWEDVIRMAVAHARPRERAEFISELLKSGDEAADAQTGARIHLLAAACLEQAVDLTASVREEVRARAATLIPPSSPEAARDLARMGPLVLELLPDPEGLDDVESLNTVIAASYIQSEATLPYLARFARHPSQLVRSQLMWFWGRHDCRTYAEQVITRLDPADLYYTLQHDEQAAELDRLGLRPDRLDLRGALSPDAASALIATCVPTALRIGVHPGRLTAPAARALRHVSEMSLQELEHPSYWSLDLLPADAPLQVLDMSDLQEPVKGLEHIGRWPKLETVHLGRAGGPASPEEWQAFASLPRLATLSLSSDSLAHARPVVSLHGVTHLTVLQTSQFTILTTEIPAAFPNLTILRLLPTTRTKKIRLAPLARLPHLRQLLVPIDQVHDPESLPPRIQVADPS